ncbi:MAG: Na/Pi symporter, partial [Clostridiales bacterium]
MEVLFGLFGGLAIFIFGMQALGTGLQKVAGGKMKHILEVLTTVPVVGVLLGAGVTAVVQSSSLTTVMVVGFVNAGMMTLKQAISV